MPITLKKKGWQVMAKIIEGKRRVILLTTDDIINVVREYQNLTRRSFNYEHTREILNSSPLYLPEDK